jgi:hypothetical protein
VDVHRPFPPFPQDAADIIIVGIPAGDQADPEGPVLEGLVIEAEKPGKNIEASFQIRSDSFYGFHRGPAGPIVPAVDLIVGAPAQRPRLLSNAGMGPRRQARQ